MARQRAPRGRPWRYCSAYLWLAATGMVLSPTLCVRVAEQRRSTRRRISSRNYSAKGELWGSAAASEAAAAAAAGEAIRNFRRTKKEGKGRESKGSKGDMESDQDSDREGDDEVTNDMTSGQGGSSNWLESPGSNQVPVPSPSVQTTLAPTTDFDSAPSVNKVLMPSGEFLDKPSLEKAEQSEAPTDMPSPSPTSTSIIMTQAKDYPTTFSVHMSAASMVPKSTYLNTTTEIDLSTHYASTLDAVVTALKRVITQDLDYFYHDSTANEVHDDEQFSTMPRTVIHESSSVSSGNQTVVVPEGHADMVPITWIAIESVYRLPRLDDLAWGEPPENDTDLFDDDESDNIFRVDQGEEEEKEKLVESNQIYAERLERLQDLLLNTTEARIRDGTLVDWMRNENPSIVGAMMRRWGQDVMFVLKLEPPDSPEEPPGSTPTEPPDSNTPATPLGKRPIVDFPFADPLDISTWDSLQRLGLIVFGLTFVGTTLLCLVAQVRRKEHHRQKSRATVMISSEAAVNDLLEWSAHLLPSQYLYRTDDCAPILVHMPAHEWDDSSDTGPQQAPLSLDKDDHGALS